MVTLGNGGLGLPLSFLLFFRDDFFLSELVLINGLAASVGVKLVTSTSSLMSSDNRVALILTSLSLSCSSGSDPWAALLDFRLQLINLCILVLCLTK